MANMDAGAMTREEIIGLMKDYIRIDVKTTSEYVGGCCDSQGGGSMYKECHTLVLKIDDEIIQEVYL